MPTTIPPEQLLASLRWRYATKRFDPARPIDPTAWAALEQSLVLAPSSFGLQPWKFLVVDDPRLRQELRQHSWGQSQITDASKLVVLLGRRTTTADDVDRLLRRQSEVRGVPVESLAGYRKVVTGFLQTGWAAADLAAWNARQVYIALGQFMAAAAMLGIDTCPMEGLDAAGYDRVLGLADSPYQTVVACTAGHRHADDKYATAAKVRFPAAEVIEHR